MKSLSREVAKEVDLTPASPAPTSLRAKRTAERMAKSGKWVESLRCSDVSRLWSELHRIVSHHPLVRASRSAGLLVEEGASSAYTDLTQELFVQLLSKNRFEHYLDTEMTDYEIVIVSLAAFRHSSNRAQISVALIQVELATNRIGG